MVNLATASLALEGIVNLVQHVWSMIAAMGHQAASSVQGGSTYQMGNAKTVHCQTTASNVMPPTRRDALNAPQATT